ncbi:hypothetical protein [Nannocystis exedens]|uniref:hypothetical protein n=1 Tax=Nannocystis exedens TaxID=54 RepID=UPI0011603403|nr:hypothetical protein [Nannocystis exedens]
MGSFDGNRTFGVVDEPGFLRAFAPDGTELWSTETSYGELAVSPAGQIFLVNSLTGIHAFDPDGTQVANWDPFPGLGVAGLAPLATDSTSAPATPRTRSGSSSTASTPPRASPCGRGPPRRGSR